MVDATTEGKLAARFEITKLPTLFFFNHGKKMEFTGNKDKETIVGWINMFSIPISTRLLDCDDLKAKTADAKLALSYFGPLEGDLFD